MGVLVLSRRLQAHRRQHLVHPLRPVLLAELCVEEERLLDLPPHRQDGVERGHRVLKDHGHPVPPYLPHLRLAHRRDIRAVQQDLSAADLSDPIRQEPENAQRGCGFARAGLAHQPQCLPSPQRQIHAVDSVDGPVMGFVLHMQISDLQQGSHFSPPLRIFYPFFSLGSSASRRPSPIRLMDSTVTAMAAPGMMTCQG